MTYIFDENISDKEILLEIEDVIVPQLYRPSKVYLLNFENKTFAIGYDVQSKLMIPEGVITLGKDTFGPQRFDISYRLSNNP